MQIIRVTKECERAGAYYVHIQTMMRKHQIPLDAEAEKWMLEQGFKKVVISSRVGLEGFYKKMGYRFNENGKPHHDTFQCVYMEKEL